MDKKILILDSDTRSSLAFVRAIGNFDYSITTASAGITSISSESKFSKEHLVSPHSSESPDEYQNWLLKLIDSNEFDYIIPMTDSCINALSSVDYLIKQKSNYPVLDHKYLVKIQDKYELLNTAKHIGIKTLPTEILNKSENIEKKLLHLKFPLILKPRQSIYRINNKLKTYPRTIVKNIKDAEAFLKNIPEGVDYLAQNLAHGNGIGVFCLIKNGTSIIDFFHKRILEKPPSGGVSVLSESIPIDRDLLLKVHELLNQFKYEGVVMTEFKLDQDTPYLMEVNPRFWGSLQLAIDAGCNFPLAILNSDKIFDEYISGKRLRWELGTVDHFILLLKEYGFRSIPSIILNNKLQFLKGDTSFEVARLNDFKPFIYELKNYFKK